MASAFVTQTECSWKLGNNENCLVYYYRLTKAIKEYSVCEGGPQLSMELVLPEQLNISAVN